MDRITKTFEAYNTPVKFLISLCFPLICGLFFNDLVFSKEAHLRETSSVLNKIKKKTSEGIGMISLMKTSPKVTPLDRKVQEALRSVTKKMKHAAENREISPLPEKMRAGTGGKIAIEKGKTEEEIHYLNEILNITKGMNSWLKKQEGSVTQNTKNGIRKLYLNMKKAAENN